MHVKFDCFEDKKLPFSMDAVSICAEMINPKYEEFVNFNEKIYLIVVSIWTSILLEYLPKLLGSLPISKYILSRSKFPRKFGVTLNVLVQVHLYKNNVD